MIDRLGEAWRIAFEEAWASWRAGNFGIGAVLIDPADDSVVATGRNRVAQRHRDPGQLSGNMTAHAEMNAFAGLDRFNAEGLHLYTTLEPCLMCAATAMQLKVEHVHLAARDEFFDGLADLWAAHPLTHDRVPKVSGPFDGPEVKLANFARLLPMSFTLRHLSGRAADTLARAEHPELAELIDELDAADGLDRLTEISSVSTAMSELWPRLPG